MPTFNIILLVACVAILIEFAIAIFDKVEARYIYEREMKRVPGLKDIRP